MIHAGRHQGNNMGEENNNIQIVATPCGNGIIQLKVPLPFRLDHINCYLIEGLNGFVLIDTGLNSDLSKTLWQQFLHSDYLSRPITAIVLTHLHPDHIGMSHWLQDELNIPVYLAAADIAMVRELWCADSAASAIEFSAHWGRFGFPTDMLNQLIERRASYKGLVQQLPRELTVLDEGVIDALLGADWEMVRVPGHSAGHICLYHRVSQSMLTGDHVLPRITPNISLHVQGSRNPLQDYIQSLQLVRRFECTRYFPAHGAVGNDLHERAQEIIEHHDDKCQQILAATDGAETVFDFMPFLFDKAIPPHQWMFAYGETAAHLVYMVARGLLVCDGAPWCFRLPTLAANTAEVVQA